MRWDNGRILASFYYSFVILSDFSVGVWRVELPFWFKLAIFSLKITGFTVTEFGRIVWIIISLYFLMSLVSSGKNGLFWVLKVDFERSNEVVLFNNIVFIIIQIIKCWFSHWNLFCVHISIVLEDFPGQSRLLIQYSRCNLTFSAIITDSLQVCIEDWIFF